jgi:hypothetical protein
MIITLLISPVLCYDYMQSPAFSDSEETNLYPQIRLLNWEVGNVAQQQQEQLIGIAGRVQ